MLEWNYTIIHTPRLLLKQCYLYIYIFIVLMVWLIAERFAKELNYSIHIDIKIVRESLKFTPFIDCNTVWIWFETFFLFELLFICYNFGLWLVFCLVVDLIWFFD